MVIAVPKLTEFSDREEEPNSSLTTVYDCVLPMDHTLYKRDIIHAKN